MSKVDRTVHTNTIEGFFSVFKRGMKSVYQHCGHQHLNRYVTEFDFRYNNRAANGINDAQRADLLLLGVVGKRLTYRSVVAESPHRRKKVTADGSKEVKAKRPEEAGG